MSVADQETGFRGSDLGLHCIRVTLSVGYRPGGGAGCSTEALR